jgi:exopolysaccharide biosynthesis WecB/TagA/CpsF family protein
MSQLNTTQRRLRALRNAKTLRWLLRVQAVEHLPESGVLFSFNGRTFSTLIPTAPFSRICGVVDGVSAKLLPSFWSIPRLRGVDVVRELIINDPEQVVLWGGSQKVLNRLPATLERYSGFAEEFDQEVAFHRVRSSQKKIALLFLGSPRQEQMAVRLSQLNPRMLIIPAGGAIDVISGAIPEAPLLFQRLGLEWFFRCCNEPGRILRLAVSFRGVWRGLRYL